MVELKSAWEREVQARLTADDGIAEVIKRVEKRGGIFVGWERLWAPASPAKERLSTAIYIGCGSWHAPEKLIFLDWSIELAKKALSDPRFEISEGNSQKAWKQADEYPGNHGETLAVLCIAKAFREDEEPDSEALAKAALQIVETALAGDWDEITQSRYLEAIHLLMICEKVAEAKRLLKTNRKFKFTQAHFEWLSEFADAIPDKPPHNISKQEAIKSFNLKFDYLRHPMYKRSKNPGEYLGIENSIHRLEIALLKQKYVLNLPYAGRWQQIFSLISE